MTNIRFDIAIVLCSRYSARRVTFTLTTAVVLKLIVDSAIVSINIVGAHYVYRWNMFVMCVGVVVSEFTLRMPTRTWMVLLEGLHIKVAVLVEVFLILRVRVLGRNHHKCGDGAVESGPPL